MSSGAVNFRGYVGRLGRRVTTVDGVIECRVGKEEVQAHRPTADAWARFWDVAEGLGVWQWGAEYGRGIRDGRPSGPGASRDGSFGAPGRRISGVVRRCGWCT